jgi:hypothetical protein
VEEHYAERIQTFPKLGRRDYMICQGVDENIILRWGL